MSPKEEYSVSDGSNLIEKRFVQDGGRSQWTFLEAEGVDDQVSDNVAGQAYHPRLREPRIRLHITRAERMWACGTRSLCVRSVLHRSSSSWSHPAACFQRPLRSRLFALALRVPRRAEWRLDSARLCASRGRRDVCMLYLHTCAGLDDPSYDSCVCPVRGHVPRTYSTYSPMPP